MMSGAKRSQMRLQLRAAQLLVDLADELFGLAVVVGHRESFRNPGGNSRLGAPPSQAREAARTLPALPGEATPSPGCYWDSVSARG